MENEYDVIILGAGATGLMAALELSLAGKKVLILEAKDRIGGRIHTIYSKKETPVELGAEFVHGDLELTQLLLKKANVPLYEVKGDVWRKEGNDFYDSDFIEDYSLLEKKFKELEHDISVKQFFDQHLNEEKHEDLRKSLQNYVEGYYAADTTLASTFALRDELQNSSDKQYRIEGGYQKLLNYFEDELNDKACTIHLSTPVSHIKWGNTTVEIITNSKSFKARKCLLTVSLGALQANAIRFSPSLDEKLKAASSLGFGPVIKVILLFKNAFWKARSLTKGKDLSKVGFLFSEETIPTWWTAYPKETAMITAWLGGPNAKSFLKASNDDILNAALQSLRNVFEVTETFLKEELIDHHYHNWINDPYVQGAYTFETVDSAKHKQFLKQPVENTIFFAGEGLHEGPEIGTVEAALISGRETAHRIIESF